jgi:sortase A
MREIPDHEGPDDVPAARASEADPGSDRHEERHAHVPRLHRPIINPHGLPDLHLPHPRRPESFGDSATIRATTAVAPSTTQASPSVARPRRDRLARILGVAGETLVTVGILLALLVVWELWWTDLGATRRQQETVEELDWAVPAVILPLPQVSQPVSPGATEDGPVYVVAADDERHRDLTAPIEPTPASAETFATIYVPRWGFDYVRPISQGTSRSKVLDPLGIGHYAATQMPGELGNFAVAGHRTTYGKPFSDIETLEIGDALVVRTEGTWYVYRVTESHIVRPTFVEALAPVPGRSGVAADASYITLTTCHPRFSARERYVVYGVLDYWADADAGYPPELVPPGSATIEDPAELANMEAEEES